MKISILVTDLNSEQTALYMYLNIPEMVKYYSENIDVKLEKLLAVREVNRPSLVTKSKLKWYVTPINLASY